MIIHSTFSNIALKPCQDFFKTCHVKQFFRKIFIEQVIIRTFLPPNFPRPFNHPRTAKIPSLPPLPKGGWGDLKGILGNWTLGKRLTEVISKGWILKFLRVGADLPRLPPLFGLVCFCGDRINTRRLSMAFLYYRALQTWKSNYIFRIKNPKSESSKAWNKESIWT